MNCQRWSERRYGLYALVRKGEVMFIEMVGDCNTSFVGLLLRDALEVRTSYRGQRSRPVIAEAQQNCF